jgi:hypothetical protein
MVSKAIIEERRWELNVPIIKTASSDASISSALFSNDDKKGSSFELIANIFCFRSCGTSPVVSISSLANCGSTIVALSVRSKRRL